MLDPRYGNNPDLVHARIMRARFDKLKTTPAFQEWKLEQYRIQAKKCAWCVKPISATFKRVHVDHALALIHGGTNDYSNLVLSHGRCNLKKWIRIDGVPQWIQNNRRKYELDKLRQAQQAILDQAAEDAWQERFAWWLKSWA